jgi:hypothetical protein
MATPAFWQGGFDVIANLVHELEGLDCAVLVSDRFRI